MKNYLFLIVLCSIFMHIVSSDNESISSASLQSLDSLYYPHDSNDQITILKRNRPSSSSDSMNAASSNSSDSQKKSKKQKKVNTSSVSFDSSIFEHQLLVGIKRISDDTKHQLNQDKLLEEVESASDCAAFKNITSSNNARSKKKITSSKLKPQSSQAALAKSLKEAQAKVRQQENDIFKLDAKIKKLDDARQEYYQSAAQKNKDSMEYCAQIASLKTNLGEALAYNQFLMDRNNELNMGLVAYQQYVNQCRQPYFVPHSGASASNQGFAQLPPEMFANSIPLPFNGSSDSSSSSSSQPLNYQPRYVAYNAGPLHLKK